MIPAEVRRRHQSCEPLLDAVQERVGETVLSYCRSSGYFFGDRRKELASIAEKLESGRYKKWSALDDLYACTIVIPTLNHETTVLEFLGRAFDTTLVKSRGSTEKRPDVFRFDATRFYGTVRPVVSQDEPGVGKIIFEVQIRTAFEHAWQVTTYALAYKTGGVDWKLERLAAQLKASVEQLDMLVMGYEQSAELLIEHPDKATLSRRQLLEGFRGLIETHLVPPELEPAVWGRFASNVQNILWLSRHSNTLSAEGVLQLCDTEARRFNERSFPRGITLFQFALGTLVERGALKLPLKGFTPLITEQAEICFPSLSKCVRLTLDD